MICVNLTVYCVDMTQTLGEVVAAQVRKLRNERGWSAARLAQRCQEVGLSLPRDVIANIENGRRATVTVEELAGLALALDTSPVRLLLPLGEAEAVRITPTMTMHPHIALDWFCGEEHAQFFHVDEPWDGERLPHGQDRKAWVASTTSLRWFRRLREVQEQVSACESAVRSAAFTKDNEAERVARRQYAEALGDLGTLLGEMRTAGLSVPTLHPRTVEDMQALGIEVDDGEH